MPGGHLTSRAAPGATPSKATDIKVQYVVDNGSVAPIPNKLDTGATKSATTIVSAATAGQISSAGQQMANSILASGSAQTSTAANQKTVASALASSGIGFNPRPNPLNIYANYTYHIRWSLTSEPTAYEMDGTLSTMNAASKTVIAESGVTAGFNIIDFEFKNNCGPGDKVMNTTSTTWTMTVVEPFGLSLIDKMLSASASQPVINWSRAPYFIEVWFNGYNEDGTIMSPNLFYTQYRVSMTKMDVKVSEVGSTYSIEGFFDGNVGHSNEIAIPPAQINIKAKNLGDFFDNLAVSINALTAAVNEQNFSITTYKFNIDPAIRDWPLRSAEVDKQNQRNSDMTLTYHDGTTTFKCGHGVSIEQIINYIWSTCPQSAGYIQVDPQGTSASSELLTQGLLQIPMIHSSVKITGWDAYTGDYIREITYSVLMHKTIKGASDRDTINTISAKSVATAKYNQLSTNGALVKEYDYIYTGLNTEIIRFDINVENAWVLALPQFEATNSYQNYTQGPVFAHSVGDLKNQGQYSKKQLLANIEQQSQKLDTALAQAGGREASLIASQKSALSAQTQAVKSSQNSAIRFGDKSQGQLVVDQAALKNPSIAAQAAAYSTLLSASKATRYAEDVSISSAPISPFPLVIRQSNDPTAQTTEQSNDSNKAMPNSGSTSIPSSRAFAGSAFDKIFSSAPSFATIEIEIRGDPYWMGQGNIDEDQTAANFGKQSNQNGSDIRANYLASTNMFLLSFRTGENYDERTGLMKFDNTSQFFNGFYGVTEVTNTFKSGSFTQTLSAYKDPLGQSVISGQTSGSSG